MPWRNQLQPASFRGAPFNVQATGGTIGRRTVIHEYPQRDLPYAEDLGRKAREFTLEAIIVGADYMAARDRLINALEATGAGELVHPYRGRVQVVVTAASISESTAEGGLVKFSITFTESGGQVNPGPRVDTGALVNTAHVIARDAIKKEFANGL